MKRISLVALLAIVSCAGAGAADVAPLRIMCLGDSITAGYTDNPKWDEPFRFGYRSGLYQRLTAAGYVFQFVGASPEPGPQAYGNPPRPLDPDLRALKQNNHRGYGGWGAELILGGIGKWVDMDRPDLVLLMIGINDCYLVSRSLKARDTLDQIVNGIFTRRPQARVIVAQITPTLKAAPQIVEYNRYIRETLVPAYQARGMQIATVDQYRNFLKADGTVDPTCFSNGINHPNNETYDRMAQTWFDGIRAMIAPPGKPTAGSDTSAPARPSSCARLEQEFLQPPDTAKPSAFWFWLGGNLSREGITADLEAMKRAGLGGANIFQATGYIEPEAVKFQSPEWVALVQHARSEARRLGLELGLHNCPGFSGSGGPWVTPEQSMQKLVYSQARLKGGQSFDRPLPQPTPVQGFYRDIVVWALPAPNPPFATLKAQSSTWWVPPQRTQDGRADTWWSCHSPKPGAKPESAEYIQFEYPEAWPVAGLYLLPGAACCPKEIEVQCSEDGKAFRPLAKATLVQGQELRLPLPETPARHFRVCFLSAYPSRSEALYSDIDVAEIAFLPRELLATGNALSGKSWDRARAVDLTPRLAADGRLSWTAPAGGAWDIWRIGHTSTGAKNHPPPKGGEGLECDKLSREALESHFNAYVGKLLGTGPAFNAVAIDSWEVGSQNWTPKFREAFQRLRGYDPLPYLPGEFGWVVDDAETTRRFAWDLRMTVSDLLLDNYAGFMRELAQRHGMQLWMEGYFHVPAVELAYAGRADVPMGEFWLGSRGERGWGVSFCKAMASAAHVYGKPVVAAEAFTAVADGADWREHPGSFKAMGDWALTAGINRMVYHSYALQPRMDVAPGLTFVSNGQHFNRNNTWWEQFKGWNLYLARCQHLLQQGLFAADICRLDVEESPRGASEACNRPLPDGYASDVCPAEVVHTRMSVKDGRIVLSDGMNYRLLVLPATEKMTPATLGKVVELVKAGATVVATTRPTQSPSLQGYPACDEQVRTLAHELFGEMTQAPTSGVAEARCGAGRVLLAREMAPALEAVGLKPDLELTGLAKEAKVNWIHRRTGEGDFYFIANGKDREETVAATFRQAGRQPELWHPETGTIRPLPEFVEENGRTKVPLRLGPSESFFVVFRSNTDSRKGIGAGGPPPVVLRSDSALPAGDGRLQNGQDQSLEMRATGKNWPTFAPLMELTGPWEVQFDPQWYYGSDGRRVTSNECRVVFDKLENWSQRPEEAVKYFSGTAIYRKAFDCPLPTANCPLYLDLGRVEISAEVILNGQNLGIAWKAPYRLDVSGRLKPGRNTLEVRVVNLWINRLIGDEQLPPEGEWKQFTQFAKGKFCTLRTTWPDWLLQGKPNPSGRRTFSLVRWQQKDDPLVPSGLLGPVRLMRDENEATR